MKGKEKFFFKLGLEYESCIGVCFMERKGFWFVEFYLLNFIIVSFDGWGN